MAHFLGLTIPLRVLSCSQDACSITDPVACSKSLAQQGLASVLHPDSHAVQGDHLVCECYVYFVLCVCVCPFMWHCHRQVLGKGSACKPWARHPDATTHPTQSRFFGVGGGGGAENKESTALVIQGLGGTVERCRAWGWDQGLGQGRGCWRKVTTHPPAVLGLLDTNLPCPLPSEVGCHNRKCQPTPAHCSLDVCRQLGVRRSFSLGYLESWGPSGAPPRLTLREAPGIQITLRRHVTYFGVGKH